MRDYLSGRAYPCTSSLGNARPYHLVEFFIPPTPPTPTAIAVVRRAFVPSTISSSLSPARSTLTCVSSTSSLTSVSSVSAHLRRASSSPSDSPPPLEPESADTGDDTLPPPLISVHDLLRADSPVAPPIEPLTPPSVQLHYDVPPTPRQLLDAAVARDTRPLLFPETVYGDTPPQLQQQRLAHPWCSARHAALHLRLEIEQAVRDVLNNSPIIRRDHDVDDLIAQEIHTRTLELTEAPVFGRDHRLQHLHHQQSFYAVGPHLRLLPLRGRDQTYPTLEISGNLAIVKLPLPPSPIAQPVPLFLPSPTPSCSATPTGAVWDISSPSSRPSIARSSSTTPYTPLRPSALLAPLAQDAPTEDSFVRVHIIDTLGPSRTTVTTLDLLDNHARCVEPFDNAQPFLYQLPSRTPTAPPVFDIDFVWELHDRLARIPRRHSHRVTNRHPSARRFHPYADRYGVASH
ncbi:hypothetical protein BKA62DRAFT_780000 [Auriculariales sp. MPI-PUGE-AT-0066]|nr:hypothetical protein BKA62DRAFT_780000 [Auriculariales sp. MPI-PUGE-AT-0066]